MVEDNQIELYVDNLLRKVEISELNPLELVEYPSEWFAKNPNKKPSITIKKPGVSEADFIILASIDPKIDLESALTFLHLTIPRFFSVESTTETWESYGVKINCDENGRLNPFCLLEVVYSSASTSIDTKETQTDDRRILSRIVAILCIYRYARATGSQRGYNKALFKYILWVISEGPYYIKDMDEGFISERVSWESDPRYRKIVAATDMFFHKFNGNPYSKIKVALLGSRYRGFGAIGALSDFGHYLGVSTKESTYFLFDKAIGPELHRLAKSGEEYNKEDSYFPYAKDLNLWNKSPYSNSANPRLYNMVYCVGSFLLNQKAINARLFHDDNIAETASIAAFIAFYKAKEVVRKRIAHKPGTGKESRVKFEKVLGSMTSTGGLPDEIFSVMVEHNFQFPDHFRMFHKKRLETRTRVRDKTIGNYVKGVCN